MLTIQKNAMIKLYAKSLAQAAKKVDASDTPGLCTLGGAKWIASDSIVHNRREIQNAAEKLHGFKAYELTKEDELQAVKLANELLGDVELFIFAPSAYTLYVGRYKYSC